MKKNERDLLALYEKDDALDVDLNPKVDSNLSEVIRKQQTNIDARAKECKDSDKAQFLKSIQSDVLSSIALETRLKMPTTIAGGREIEASLFQWLLIKKFEKAILEENRQDLSYLIDKLLPNEQNVNVKSEGVMTHLTQTLDPALMQILSSPGGVITEAIYVEEDDEIEIG